MALQNEDKIGELKGEISSLNTVSKTMREDMKEERTITSGLQRAVLALYAALYGKQLDDIKHSYKLDEEGNEMIRSGIRYGEDARKANRNNMKYSDVLVKATTTTAAAASTDVQQQQQQQQQQ